MSNSRWHASWTSGVIVGLLAALSACGGGGGDDSPPPGGGNPPVTTLPDCPAAPNTLRDITAVQGPGALSPFDGQAVTVRGVVTADFQGDAQLKGFFIQQPVADADPKTSEGLFVFAPGGADVKLGDYVQASGTVSEFKSGTTDPERLTELATVTAISTCGAGPAIAAREVTLPLASATDLEAVEGMLVEFKQTLTVSEVYNLGRYGELVLSTGGRLFQANNHPGTATRDEVNAANALAKIVLDDGAGIQNPTPIPYLSAADSTGTRRVGDTVAGVRGVVTWTADAFHVHPVAAPAFTAANPRPAAPAAVGGTLRAGSLNVLNYFTTLGQRGANTAEELTRQRAKLVETIVGLNADALGLMEIENNGTAALADLVGAVNAKLGANTYAWIDAGKPGTDAITVAMIYKPARVTPIGNAVVPTDPDFAVDGGLRPPVAQRFAAVDNHGGFWLVVNHLKSKGSCPTSVDDLDADKGQGCWNVSRFRQALALQKWVNGLIDASGETDVLMVGDFNSYLSEDPVKSLEGGGFEALLKRLPEDARYSYVFNGESGALDHAFASETLGAQVNGIAVWHVNADEPLVLDYNTEFKTDDRYAVTPYRSSDHDPVLVGLTLAADAPAIVPALAATLPSSAVAGTAVSITGIAATNGTALSVAWGDGTTETPAVGVTTLAHTYAAAGSYALKLVLSDAGGQTAERSGTVVVSAAPSTGDTPELFFSEYVEGSSNNKAVEIYNPTSGTVDLTAYTVRLYANGAAAPTSSLALTGTLESGKTLLLINTAFTTSATLPGAVKHGVANFNGDDAVTLEKSGTVIDAFGQVGFDPGTAWTGGSLSTLDRTLRRKPGIVHGSVPAAAPAVWDPSGEWAGFPIDTFDGLGSHAAR
ncbi:ExeM/NucH family extracellular endonuclease [Rhizobacter sp. Root16D2]|uniref:ExeM/NucH family extracellular endonuclease n=1 Tax=Rhizobacter sp. Root16D2 TaxID=1736479 RepID=UPI0007011A60|nr:ExeM/NucH family extracellular endonuclease [Rhizobacter sp. Root16D2]KRB19856.1 hypothetical protein ASE08_23725 [Rhizobacter sp. Root16D2]